MTVTLITGSNNGLGHETARQLLDRGHTVYLGARNAGRGEAAAAALGGRFVWMSWSTTRASVRRATSPARSLCRSSTRTPSVS